MITILQGILSYLIFTYRLDAKIVPEEYGNEFYIWN